MPFHSVQFSLSVVSDSLRPHEPQHARPPYPSPTAGVHQNPCPLNWCCHPTISSSGIPFSSHLQFFPASGSFQMSQFFASGGQITGVSASVLPMNIQDWFPLGLTGWISSLVFSSTTIQKNKFFGAQLCLWSNSHIHTWPLQKTISLTIWTLVGKVMSLLFNILSRFVIAFLPRSKHLFILWLQSPPTVILEPKKIKPVTVNFPLVFVMKWWAQMPWS